MSERNSTIRYSTNIESVPGGVCLKGIVPAGTLLILRVYRGCLPQRNSTLRYSTNIESVHCTGGCLPQRNSTSRYSTNIESVQGGVCLKGTVPAGTLLILRVCRGVFV